MSLGVSNAAITPPVSRHWTEGREFTAYILYEPKLNRNYPIPPSRAMGGGRGGGLHEAKPTAQKLCQRLVPRRTRARIYDFRGRVGTTLGGSRSRGELRLHSVPRMAQEPLRQTP